MDAVIIAVKHKEFEDFNPEILAQFFNPVYKPKIFLDIKGIFNKKIFAEPEWRYWRL